MEKFFNTAGPMMPDINYCIDPLTRLDWAEVKMMIGAKRYFALHAPRQTGKTSSLLAMRDALNEEGRFVCLYANVEEAQTARGDVTRGIATICDAISAEMAGRLRLRELENWYFEECKKFEPERQLNRFLAHWAETSEKPTVLFLDEVDALVGDTLISLLRQLRAGYANRPGAFPQSVVLCGVRDVRDYRINQGDGEVVTGGSAFNIKTESLRMGNFSIEETKSLWLQHTAETGQEFDGAIFAELWEDTYGQPWLINALGYEVTWKLRPCRDRGRKITIGDYKEARENLIQSRATHLDQLADKLREPRVFNVINGILTGEPDGDNRILLDDTQYVADLGLVRTRPSIRVSNRIYQEIIPRELTSVVQTRIPNQEQEWYIDNRRRLNIVKLLSAFQQFYREHSQIWTKSVMYEEAAPQLLLQAFLQRIVNGGGIITREYGLGRKRTDLFIEWLLDESLGMRGPLQRIVVEVKLLRGALDKLIEDGLEQVTSYASQVGADEAHLMVFDRSADKPWDEKIWRRDEQFEERRISVWGA